jgi:predicted esterase
MDRQRLFAIAAVLWLLGGSDALAGKATLKNGTVISGELVPLPGLTERQFRHPSGEIVTNPYVMIDEVYKRYFVPSRQIAVPDQGQSLIPFDVFKLKQIQSPTGLSVESIGLPISVTPFSDRGVRTVTLSTAQGPKPIVQGVTRIEPQFVTIEGITHKWWQGITTSALPPDDLAAMLHAATDAQNPDDRMSIARFYLQAGMYEASARELEGISRDFPELSAKVQEIDRDLRQLRAKWLLSELRKRQAAGQHEFAYAAAEAFPKDLGFDAEVLRQVDELRSSYRDARERADRALLLLGQLEAGLENEQQRSAVSAQRSSLMEQLDWNSLPRLDAFLTLADDESLSAAERLALAYSGWVVGSAKATTDLPKALNLWRARHLVGECLRADDPGRRSQLYAELSELESVGPEAIEDLIPWIPPWIETPTASPGQTLVLETQEKVPSWGAEPDSGKAVLANAAGPVRYAVTLPPEYAPTRAYPMIVSLRAAEWNIEKAAAFWGEGRDGAGRPAPGPATREGYIVIAPEYASPKQTSYGYTAREHLAVLAAIRDAKARFTIDSDRVFLAGHGMGGDATFDIAMSHPDLFAGAIPISGLCGKPIGFYKQNAETVPLYIVNGERDRGSREVNAPDLSWMMKRSYDVIWCEFVGRGYEYYHEETPNIMSWAGLLRRAADPKDIDVKIARASDDRFYWVKVEGIPQNAFTGKPMMLQARITEGNTISLRSGATRHVLRLNRGLVDLDQRVKVSDSGRQKFNDFLVPDVAALLDDVRENGDRQRLYPVRLNIN